MKRFLLFAIFMFFSGAATAGTSLDLKVHYPPGGGAYWIDITSREDTITIRDIRVNRGNCALKDLTYGAKLPITLKFGQITPIGLFFVGGCIPIEIEFSTDKGDFRIDAPRY